jgi:hypothetical protein
MGLTRSPLTVDELLEALKDPRFNVRFEAIISIARMGSEPRLVNALCRILDGTELSLSVIAAWALGRMGNDDALPTLRRGLESPYRSIQAHCARALGTLDDQSMIPLLLERLPVETDKGLRIAYASALGSLRAQTALPALFDVLDQTENEGARMELALSIARVLGDESHFIRLLRQVRQDCGTAAAQETLLWKRKLEKSASTELRAKIDHASNEFAWGRLDVGAKQLAEILNEIPHEADQPCTRIIQHGAAKLHELGAKRLEYLVLIFHAMYEEGD